MNRGQFVQGSKHGHVLIKNHTKMIGPREVGKNCQRCMWVEGTDCTHCNFQAFPSVFPDFFSGLRDVLPFNACSLVSVYEKAFKGEYTLLIRLLFKM